MPEILALLLKLALMGLTPLFLLPETRTPINVIQCSLCRRPGAWMIDNEVFCERHKEEIIKRSDVARFNIRRLTENERVFRWGGRAALPASAEKEEEKEQKAGKESDG